MFERILFSLFLAGGLLTACGGGGGSDGNVSDPTGRSIQPVELAVAGPQSIPEDGSGSLTATVRYSDGSSADATETVTWYENSDALIVDGRGGVTARPVDADHTVRVTAYYREGANMVEASKSLTVRDGGDTAPAGSHAGRFAVFAGTQTCLTCHEDEARQVHASVHYQWKGDASETVGLAAAEAGKLGGINDFCIYPDINWIGKLTNVEGKAVDGGCAKCHVGLGEKPAAAATRDQLENIDCLVCHAARYKRTVADVGGRFAFVPDTAAMSVDLLEAAVDITLPDNDRCLNCHANAGGGNNFKRGDLEEAHRNAGRSFDVHMAAAAVGGAELGCIDCHFAEDHRMAGRGTDLRQRELAVDIDCAGCHGKRPHGERDIDRHTARVHCSVCHIPRYATIAATDMNRDWSAPGELVAKTGLYEPAHAKGRYVVPEYRFFDGRSYFYEFGAAATAQSNGRVLMAAPLGGIDTAGAKIHAFKRHRALQPADPATGRLLPLKIGKFFETGQIEAAVSLGVAAVGWDDYGYDFVQTERWMGLFHEVAPKEAALSCGDCHGGGRLDFDALGYAPRSTYNGRPLCSACHEEEDEDDEWGGSWFQGVHRQHVDEERYDCSVCHRFSKAG
jgi:hypothetical protein